MLKKVEKSCVYVWTYPIFGALSCSYIFLRRVEWLLFYQFFTDELKNWLEGRPLDSSRYTQSLVKKIKEFVINDVNAATVVRVFVIFCPFIESLEGNFVIFVPCSFLHWFYLVTGSPPNYPRHHPHPTSNTTHNSRHPRLWRILLSPPHVTTHHRKRKGDTVIF